MTFTVTLQALSFTVDMPQELLAALIGGGAGGEVIRRWWRGRDNRPV